MQISGNPLTGMSPREATDSKVLLGLHTGLQSGIIQPERKTLFNIKPPMAIRVEITAEEKDKFLASFPSSGTRIYVDLNKEKACGPNPLEVFLCSLASCVCVYARKYLTQHSIEFKELQVTATAELSKDSPMRLVDITIKTHTNAKLDNAEKEVFLRFMKNCPIHNTVIHSKNIEIDLV